VTFYEGTGSNAETLVSLALGAATLVYIPLTIASLGRRAWTRLRVTDRRFVYELSSPIRQQRVEFTWPEVASVDTVPRCFGAWGDMVVRLKNGDLHQIVGIDRHEEIRDYIRGRLV